MRYLLLLILILSLQSSTFAQGKGWWCAQATPFSDSLSLPAPNGEYQIVAIHDSDGASVQIDKNHRTLRTIDTYYLSEIAWSPNSSMFFITQSEGGQLGQWSVHVYRVTGTSVKRVRVGRSVSADFREKMKSWCPGEVPNFVGAGWANEGNSILIVGVVPNHSSCREMGRVHGYLVSSRTGNLIASYSEVALKNSWKQILGSNFKD